MPVTYVFYNNRSTDQIFLESLDVVFSISLALLSVHKDGLMLCESCEEAAEYLKHKLPDIDSSMYDRIMKIVSIWYKVLFGIVKKYLKKVDVSEILKLFVSSERTLPFSFSYYKTIVVYIPELF